MRARRILAVVCGVVSFLVSACGSGAPRDAATAAQGSAEAVAPGAIGIWDDAFVPGWVDWSWGSTRATTASPVASGASALAVTFAAWGGVYFRRTAGSVSGMATLDLYANGGSRAGDQILVWAVQGSTNLPGVSLASYCSGATIPANAWTHCSIPLTAMVPAGGSIDGIIVQEIAGAALPTMYFDAVTLAPAVLAQPKGVTATASTGSIAVSWPAVAGATGYDVSRATASSGPFARVSAQGQPGTTYQDTAVTAGATYWYQVASRNAGGASSPSAAVSATVPAAGLPVYADALASGWSDWSWGSTRDFAATSPVASGTRSLAVTFQAWGGIYFRHTAGPISGMASFEFSANGGAAAGNLLQVRAVQGNTELANVMLAPYCSGGTIPANAWTRCKVPLTALAPAGASIDGILLQEIDGSARPTMYFDDVGLTGTAAPPPPPALPPAPTNLAATVSSGAVSLSWSAVSGATGYLVSRATASAGPFSALTPSAQAETTYRDAAVVLGATYWYRVATVNAAGTGSASAAVSAAVPPGASTVTVTISPASATVDACTSAQLSATVTGVADTSVTWSIQEGATGGSVDASGKYTAPSAAGTYHLVATSKASASASATVPVVVKDHILSLTVNPVSPALKTGGTQQLSAVVSTSCGSFPATGP